jgi:hypothetical protein
LWEKLQEEKSQKTFDRMVESSKTTDRIKDHTSRSISSRQIFDEELKVQYTSNETAETRKLDDLLAPKN